MKSILVLLLAVAPWLAAEQGTVPKVFGGGQISEVLWVRLDKGDLVLESLQKFIDERKIRDGSVLSAVGGLEICRFHGVNGTMTTVEEPVELLHLAGLVADGKPHLHIVVSNKARGAFGGHLEEGCKVLSQVEIGIARFGGVEMTRKSRGGGPSALQKK
jgi:uncharacterized protein